MRIISGKSRGTKLETLLGKDTRPTLDRVKESLFNIIQSDILGCIFLDLFSGSGAIGLEAISRGARKAILCDNSKNAIEIIKKNTIKTHSEEKTEIFTCDYEELLKNKIKEKIDITYIDPPYSSDFTGKAIKYLLDKELITDNSLVIVETDDKEKILKEIEKLKIQIIDTRKYGRAYLIFLKKI